jgi:SAM-dependent methyltransferase
MPDVDLESLQRQWEAFGQDDPLWAILASPDKRHGRWTPGEFFATGLAEVRTTLAQVDALPPSIPRRRALDFGCGVGRLSQALGDYFETCDGVDIAPAMIEKARRFNRHGGRCLYHVNAADNLSLFPDDSFDLIYSNVVLQHMPPELFEPYLREFVRVLHPDGLAVFQLPDERGALQAPGAPRAHHPLPDGAFRAALRPIDVPRVAVADVDLVIAVRVTNISAAPWPSSGEIGGHLKVHLGNHWADRQGPRIVSDDGRASLPGDLGPGESATIQLWVRTPPRKGRYVLELDMVQEGVAWFENRGSQPARVPIEIRGRHVPIAERVRSWWKASRAPRSSAGAEPSTKLLMYGARPARVASVLAGAGGHIVDIRRDGQTGEWPGYVYTVSKSSARSAVDVAAWLAVQEAAIRLARASITCEATQLELAVGQAAALDVSVCNDSPMSWSATASPSQPFVIRLGNHWLAPEGSRSILDDGRVDLPRDVRAGGVFQARLAIRAPHEPGEWTLELDLVSEGVTWFHQLGSGTTRIPVRVR